MKKILKNNFQFWLTNFPLNYKLKMRAIFFHFKVKTKFRLQVSNNFNHVQLVNGWKLSPAGENIIKIYWNVSLKQWYVEILLKNFSLHSPAFSFILTHVKSGKMTNSFHCSHEPYPVFSRASKFFSFIFLFNGKSLMPVFTMRPSISNDFHSLTEWSRCLLTFNSSSSGESTLINDDWKFSRTHVHATPQPHSLWTLNFSEVKINISNVKFFKWKTLNTPSIPIGNNSNFYYCKSIIGWVTVYLKWFWLENSTPEALLFVYKFYQKKNILILYGKWVRI